MLIEQKIIEGECSEMIELFNYIHWRFPLLKAHQQLVIYEHSQKLWVIIHTCCKNFLLKIIKKVYLRRSINSRWKLLQKKPGKLFNKIVITRSSHLKMISLIKSQPKVLLSLINIKIINIQKCKINIFVRWNKI
jgi:hypothetical protein